MLSTLLWLSLTVYHEGRNQEHLDQLAIAHTILNRAKNSSVKEVVLKPKQFSCYNDVVKFPTDGKALLTSVHVAWTALQGTDFTGGAIFYHTKKVKPKWRNKVSYVGDFGDHKFYKPLVKIQARKVIKYGKAIARSSSRNSINSYGS